MLIDWFTVIAQIVNFLVLIGLLKYFLYDRILNAMDEREKRIAARLDEAQTKKDEAEEEAEEYRRKQQELEDRKREMLQEAKEEAEKNRKDLMAQARDEADKAKEQWMSAVKRERKSFLRDVRLKIGHEAVSLARVTLKDLSDADLNRRVAQRFIQEIEQLDDEEVTRIREAAHGDSASIGITSAFPLEDESRENLKQALSERIGEDLEFTFEESSELICGIALTIPGYKIGWNVQGYLESLEEHVTKVMDSGTAEDDSGEVGEQQQKEA